jgi:ATP synthase protein I
MKPDANGELQREVKKRVRRIERAQRERDSLLAQTTFLGSIAGLFVVPIVGGAYLGRWLDGLQQGYSVRWTVSLIVLGVAIGAVNVYLYLKKNDGPWTR